MAKIELKRNDDDTEYIALSGERITREYGETPNGNSLNGMWVYRDSTGKFIDYDKYRYDLAGRNNLELK